MPRLADLRAPRPSPTAWSCTRRATTVKQIQDGVLEFLLDQPPARLPGVRPRRRVPAAGPDARVRSGRVALRRGEAPLREADPDQRPRAARPRALHPVRPLHPLRRRDRRRPADRLRRPRRPHRRSSTSPTQPFDSYFSGNTVQICPVGALTATPVPLPGPAVGPRRRSRRRAPTCAVQLPRRAAVVVEPARAPARRRLRAGEPRLALRQGPLRLSSGCTPSDRVLEPHGAQATASCVEVSWPEALDARRRRRSRGALDAARRRRRSRCSAARAAPTRTRTCGRGSPRACSAPTTSTPSSATGCRPRSCSACPRATIADLDRARGDRAARPRPQRGAAGPLPAPAPGRGRARRAARRARARASGLTPRRHRGAAPRARRGRRDGRAVRTRARRRRHRVG